jgi:DNA polymerase-1
MQTSNGTHTNAVYGFLNMLNKLISEYDPQYMAVAFDMRGPTFRNSIYSDYKANRKGMPEELATQMPLAHRLVECLGIKIVELQGYEADDIIGTLSKKFDIDTCIVTGDRDILQLLDKTTKVLMPKRGVSDMTLFTVKKLAEEGLTPEQIIEYKSLAGDSSDNIPGVRGIGDKTARVLLAQYYDLDKIYQSIDEIKESTRMKLLANRELAYLSKQLATININVPIECDVSTMKFDKMNVSPDYQQLLRELEFTNALEKLRTARELEHLLSLATANTASQSQYSQVADPASTTSKSSTHPLEQPVVVTNQHVYVQTLDQLTTSDKSSCKQTLEQSSPISKSNCEQTLEQLIATSKPLPAQSLDQTTTNKPSHHQIQNQSPPVVDSRYWQTLDQMAATIKSSQAQELEQQSATSEYHYQEKLDETSNNDQEPDKSENNQIQNKINIQHIADLKKVIPENLKTIALNILPFAEQKETKSKSKSPTNMLTGDKLFFAFDGSIEYSVIEVNDLLKPTITIESALSELKKYLESSTVHKLLFDAKSIAHFLSRYGITLSEPYDDLLIESYLLNSDNPPNTITNLLNRYDITYGVEAMFQVQADLSAKLNEMGLVQLYKNIELPLINVLYEMEHCGIAVDDSVVSDLKLKFNTEINLLKKEIFNMAGETFNLNSTSELSNILFTKMGLKNPKKKDMSVAAEILTEIDHPIIPLILRYRRLFKLLSTYINGALALVDPKTKRLHTMFDQCGTTTGRLSSLKPNMQNIPIKTDEGQEIRRIFVAAPGKILIAADYSQIELRLLAHFSADPVLLNAYAHNEDIHALVASKIHGVPLDRVTKSMRKAAKAVNFGIIYGISRFGLARNIDATPVEAGNFITRYFKTYPTVKDYMESNLTAARRDGFLRTPWGRIRYFRDITSSKGRIRELAERAALNMPLQGAAADIIKIAMIKTHKSLQNCGLKAQLILQVHDELIIESDVEEADEVSYILKSSMENAVKLSVPLVAEIRRGKDWFSAV